MYEPPIIIDLPTGDLGLTFSKTIPCEIRSVEEESPIFESSLQCLGRLAFYLSIPNKLDIYGSFDSETLEKILDAYSNIPNRKLMFKNRGDDFNQGLITTTILPTGPISAAFRGSRGLFAYHNRVLVKKSPADLSFEFPAGHYVEKVIIPNQFVQEGGIRTKTRLLETLKHFEEVPGRRIVFQKNIPRGGVLTKVTLPRGPTGIVFQEKLGLPFVSMVFRGSWAERLNVPYAHYVEKMIVPNKIATERMGCDAFERIFHHFSNIDDRVLILQEIRNDVPNIGAAVTISLPTGYLGLVFRCTKGYISIARVNENSPMKDTIPTGYYVERFVIPGEFELVGIGGMNASTFTETLKRYSSVPHRILVLKEVKEEVHIAKTTYNDELVK